MLIQIFELVTLFATLFIAVFIYFNDRHSRINQSFTLFALSMALWLSANLMVDLSATEAQGLFWSRFTLVGPILIPLFFIYFVTVFSKQKIRIPSKYWFFLIIPAIIILFFVPTKLNVEIFRFISPMQEGTSPGFGATSPVEIVFGPLYTYFLLYFILYIGAGLIILLINYRKGDKEEKIRLTYLLLGLVITLICSVATNAILPMIGISGFSGIGTSSVLIFLFLTAYAIVKYRLFDVKIVITAIFVGVNTLLLLLDAVLFTDKFYLQIFKGIILIFFLFFGYLLIKSVVKEIRQKERIEKIEKELEKAYEVEKKANEELEKIDKTKNQFLMAIQHHLKTPLTSMVGYSDLLLDGSFGKQNKKTIEVIKRFHASASGLIKMVNEFLDITQFQLGKGVINLKPDVDVSVLVGEIVNELKFQAEQKGLYLKFDKPEHIPLIKADLEKLRVALVNIFDNSIKYTKEGGIEIKMESGKVLKIISSDTGIGMSKERLQKLFNSTFERGDDAKKTNATGRGIGLYLASEIIKAHNGKVRAESEGEGKGSRFYIELPIN